MLSSQVSLLHTTTLRPTCNLLYHTLFGERLSLVRIEVETLRHNRVCFRS